MPDGKRHCAIVLTTDLLVQLSGSFCGIWGLLPKGKRHRAVALTHIKLRDLLLPLCCRRTVRGGLFLCHPALGAAQRHLRAIRPTNQLLPHLGKYLLTYLLTYLLSYLVAICLHVYSPFFHLLLPRFILFFSVVQRLLKGSCLNSGKLHT